MKQSINLYTDELKPVVLKLSLARSLVAALVLTLVILVAWIVLQQIAEQRSAEADRVNQQLQQLQQQQTQLQSQVQQKNPDQQLVQQSESLSRRIQQQMQLNERLTHLESRQLIAPQQLMAELQAIDMEGLWLTEFGISEGRINLHGKAIKGNLIPSWMARFDGEPVLSDSRFSVVDLSQDEQDNQTFSLASERGSDE
ncbi:PilN domain-containing protein [Idiomarina sp. UBA3162]|uniref:PilN domain-containing protein n=1 Tax=Idiomarina sp. UBA3162 TaxID=1946641 RepID=UPI000C8C641D|nr:PilN domain-containing protein [Idiomarina sp. UBA3162]MAD52679.1 hypothetical protein [Idiomarinaceae bacterium]|tara:strand:+ start:2092 stop:2685 length:594 start_codon:yes stop_codon:yes gene_type:complete